MDAAAQTVEFDEVTHTYRVNGERWPSVTQVLDDILRPYEGVPEDLMRAAAQFGKHVHAACHLDNIGMLDEAALDPALSPYLEGWRAFRRAMGAEILISEHIVSHPRLRYCGSLDSVVLMRGKRALIDIKTTAVLPGTVGPQCAAYAEALGEPRIARYCCHLIGGGQYRLIPLTEPTDFSIYISALNLYFWRQKNGR